MVPGATSVLVLVKVQTPASQVEVKPADGGVFTSRARVLVLVRPLASLTLRLTLKLPPVG